MKKVRKLTYELLRNQLFQLFKTEKTVQLNTNIYATLQFPIASNVVFCDFNNQSVSEIVLYEKNLRIITLIGTTLKGKCREICYSKQTERLVNSFKIA